MSTANQRFSVSVHILTILAASQDTVVTSDAIAASVDTNPVVIRRMMAGLRAAGLVASRPGTAGGWKLSKPPQEINLRDVFHAANCEEVFAMHSHPNADCLIGGRIKQSLAKVFHHAQDALETSLAELTVADVLQDVLMLQKG